MRKRFVGGAVALAVIMAFGCGSRDSTSPPPAIDGGTDAPLATGTLTLYVAGEATRGPAKKPIVLANAKVAFDPPGGGERMQMVSGADGKVTFTGIDWSKGTGTVIAWAPGRTVNAIVNVSPDTIKTLTKYFDVESDAFVITCAPLPSGDQFIAVTGTIANKADPKHYVTIAPTVEGTFYQDTRDMFSMRVRKDKPFTMVATEWQLEKAPAIQSFLKWVKVDATANAPTVDVDLATATALTTAKVSRTYTIPGGASGPLGGATGYYAAQPQGGRAPYGYATEQSPSPDGSSVAIKMETVTTPELPYVGFNFLSKADGAYTSLTDTAPPVDGSTLSDFLDPPAVTVDTVRLSDPITVDGLPNDGQVIVEYTNLDGEILFQVGWLGASGSASLTITPPKLPADASKEFGNTSLRGQVTLSKVGDLVPGSDYVLHYAVSRTFSASD